eukprot:10691182-Prorocentrum_lima.AAC.1
MTSSLVGSEMCIRDRTFDILDDEFGTLGRIQCPTFKNVWEVVSGLNKDCLLYTSDAADDM